MRIIDSDLLMYEMNKHKILNIPLRRIVRKAIHAIPTLDARLVIHGYWKHWNEVEFGDTYECSKCGESLYLVEGNPKENKYHFCPFCGAQMDMEGHS